MSRATPITHALSFDIEDWFHMVEIEAVADPAGWEGLPSIVVRRTRWIIDTLAEHGQRATFFILGWVAERYPEIARAAAEAGHEVGTHSYWHRKVYDLPEAVFREDIRRSVDVLAAQTGRPVRGFRAPSFSITPGTEWAFDTLLDLGITYDASLFPAARGHGGYPCPREAHLVTAPSGRVIPELPMSVLRLRAGKGEGGGGGLAFSGGGYMRLLPLSAIRAAFSRFEKSGRPVVVYLHPRDFEPDCPRVPMPLKRRFKCYVGLAGTERKLRALLRERRFDTCAGVLAAAGFSTEPSDNAASAQPRSGSNPASAAAVYSAGEAAATPANG